jgi:hypothetical protein
MKIIEEIIAAGIKVEEHIVRINESGDVYFISGSGSVVPVFIATANTILSGHRCVVIDSGLAVYADKGTPSHATRVAGITRGAIASGASGEIQYGGEMSDPSFAFTPGAIYLGSNGLLTQTPPTSGFILEVAKALTSTRILINIQSPINL